MKLFQKIKALMKNALKNQKGMTLVELVVTFALISSLLMTAAYILTSYFNIYLRVDNLSRAKTVSMMLMDDMNGELFLASNKVTVSEGNSKISYGNSNSFKVSMFVEDGIIRVVYDEVIDPDTGQVISEEVVWHYPIKTYQQNRVTELKFYPINGRNLIKIELTLENQVTGYIYKTTKIIECYNLEHSFIEVEVDSVKIS